MNRLRKPGPAISTRSTAGPSRAPDRLAEPLRYCSRRLAERRREQHRGVGRVVAEVGPRRAVQPGGRRAARCRAGRRPPRRRHHAALRRGRSRPSEIAHPRRRPRLSSGRARARGSCGPGRSARAGPRGPAGAGSVIGPSESRMSACRSRPLGPPITKHTSRPSRRRSSSHSANCSEPKLWPSPASSTRKARSGMRGGTFSSSRTSIRSTFAWPASILR